MTQLFTTSSIEQVFLYDETLGYTEKDSCNLSIAPQHNPNLHSYFSHITSEDRRFIVYLEPSPNSPLAQSINTFYRLSRVKCGPNEAHLYHPHCSMTGFITLKPHQISSVISTISQCLNDWLPSHDQFPSPAISSIQSNSSRVVLKLNAPSFYHTLISNLVEAVSPLTRLRPKNLNHISLAYLNKHVSTSSEFSTEEISSLVELAHSTIVLDQPIAWDVVLYEQVYQSKDLLYPHKFQEITRHSVYRPPLA